MPFIARYLKEQTGEMKEIQLRDLSDRFAYLTELEDRKRVILESITEQGNLMDELSAKIEACLRKNELEDLDLPYRPKRRTRATIARERGLDALARFIDAVNALDGGPVSLDAEAETYVSAEHGVPTAAEALAGASHILAEHVPDRADLRAHVREHRMTEGVFASRVTDAGAADQPEPTTRRNAPESSASTGPNRMPCVPAPRPTIRS